MAKLLEKSSPQPTFQTVKMPAKAPLASAVKSSELFLEPTQAADRPLPVNQPQHDKHGDRPQSLTDPSRLTDAGILTKSAPTSSCFAETGAQQAGCRGRQSAH